MGQASHQMCKTLLQARTEGRTGSVSTLSHNQQRAFEDLRRGVRRLAGRRTLWESYGHGDGAG